jgi:phosphate:Na+ symporter
VTLFLEIWAAFGLLFIGVKMVGSHVQELAGGLLREQIARAFHRPLAPQALGMLSGAVTQSSAAVAVAAAGLVSSGVGVIRLLPMLPWASVGTTALLLLVAFNLHPVILFSIGLVGVALMLRLDRRDGVRHTLGAVLGLALLLFATSMLRGAVAPLRGDPAVVAFIAQISHSWLLGVLAGTVAGVLTQSSLIVTIICLPLVQAGLLTMTDVAPVVYGATLGTGIGQALLLAGGASAPVRRLMTANLILRAITFVALIALFELEVNAGLFGMVALSDYVGHTPGTHLGVLYLLVQLLLVVACELLKGPVCALVTRWVPDAPPVKKPWTQPAFIFAGGVEAADTALSLAWREQTRLFRLLPTYLDDVRDPNERAPDSLPLDQRHEGSTAVAARVADFLAQTLNANPGMGRMDRLLLQRSLLSSLQSCHELLEGFVRSVQSVAPAERPALVGSMIEALHAVLETAADALEQPDDEMALEMLGLMTDERGASMDLIRKALMQGTQSFDGREALLTATLQFERILWVLNHMRLAPARAQADLAG